MDDHLSQRRLSLAKVSRTEAQTKPRVSWSRRLLAEYTRALDRLMRLSE